MPTESRLLVFLGQRFGADFRECRRRRDRFGVDDKSYDGRFAGGLRRTERRGKIFGALDRDAEAAERTGISGKIWIAKLGRENATWIFAFLVHANSAVYAIVEDNGDECQIVLNRRRELLTVHPEVTVTGKADNLTVGIKALHRHCRGHAISHRPGGWCDKLAVAPKTKEAMHPGRKVAGAIAENGVS